MEKPLKAFISAMTSCYQGGRHRRHRRTSTLTATKRWLGTSCSEQREQIPTFIRDINYVVHNIPFCKNEISRFLGSDSRFLGSQSPLRPVADFLTRFDLPASIRYPHSERQAQSTETKRSRLLKTDPDKSQLYL